MALIERIWRVAWIVCCLAFCWTGVRSTSTFIRLAGSAEPLYCLPQPFESLVVDGFNSAEDGPKRGVLLAIDFACGQAVLPQFYELKDPSIGGALNGSIALVPLPDCPFKSFDDFFQDIRIRASIAAGLGATGVVAVLGNPGQRPPISLFSTFIPMCIMDIARGSLLFQATGPTGSALLEIDPVALPLLTNDVAPRPTSVAQLRVSGIPSLEIPLPAWPATFNPVPAAPGVVEGVVERLVLAAWAPDCVVTFEGSGEFSKCQGCWKRANSSVGSVFTNGDDFRGNVVLFHSAAANADDYFKCFSESYQRSELAESLGAQGVLLSGTSEQRHAEFPGPNLIPADLKQQAFGLLRSHGGILAARMSDPGMFVSFPDYDPDSGFPRFLSAGGEELPATAFKVEVPLADGGVGTWKCRAGRAAFSPANATRLKKDTAVIARPVGPCLLDEGSGCTLSQSTQERATGRVLILFLEDFPFFYSWTQFVSLGTAAGARALVIVNLEEAVYTFRGLSQPVSLPIFNVENRCGRRLVATVQRREFLKTGKVPEANSQMLEVTLSQVKGVRAALATVTNATTQNSTATLKGQDLISEQVLHIQDRLVGSQIRFFVGQAPVYSGSIEAYMVGFNPLMFSGTTQKLALAEVVPECLDRNTDGGLSCDLCNSRTMHLTPTDASASFDNKVVMVPAVPMQCINPQDAVTELAKAGARVVVFSSNFKNVPANPGRPMTLIPAFVVSVTESQVLIDYVKDTAVHLEVPSIEGGHTAKCHALECDILRSAASGGDSRRQGPSDFQSQDSSKDEGFSPATIVVAIVAILAGIGLAAAVGVTYLMHRMRRKPVKYASFSCRNNALAQMDSGTSGIYEASSEERSSVNLRIGSKLAEQGSTILNKLRIDG